MRIKITPEIKTYSIKYPTIEELDIGEFFIIDDVLCIKQDTDNFFIVIGEYSVDNTDQLDARERVVPVDVEIKWKERK